MRLKFGKLYLFRIIFVTGNLFAQNNYKFTTFFIQICFPNSGQACIKCDEMIYQNSFKY